jgi:hypothetical protein
MSKTRNIVTKRTFSQNFLLFYRECSSYTDSTNFNFFFNIRFPSRTKFLLPYPNSGYICSKKLRFLCSILFLLFDFITEWDRVTVNLLDLYSEGP